MRRTLLKSKLHRLTVTQTELNYEGSCAIDEALLEAADLREHEQVDIYNVHNGERFTTHVVRAPSGSGTVCVMGAAARLATPGDRLIIVAYASFDESEAATFKPRVVLVDEKNRIVKREASSRGR